MEKLEFSIIIQNLGHVQNCPNGKLFRVRNRPKLISRKNEMSEKFIKFHTVMGRRIVGLCTSNSLANARSSSQLPSEHVASKIMAML